MQVCLRISPCLNKILFSNSLSQDFAHLKWLKFFGKKILDLVIRESCLSRKVGCLGTEL